MKDRSDAMPCEESSGPATASLIKPMIDTETKARRNISSPNGADLIFERVFFLPRYTAAPLQAKCGVIWRHAPFVTEMGSPENERPDLAPTELRALNAMDANGFITKADHKDCLRKSRGKRRTGAIEYLLEYDAA